MFSKGDAKHEVIEEFITIVENEKLAFAVQRYCDYCKATRSRIFLLTMEKSHFQRNREVIVAAISDDNETDENDSGIAFINSSSTPSANPLTGSSEAKNLRDKIIRAFNKSLESDMEKENTKSEQEHIKE